MKKYSEFINEASGKNYIDVFNEDKPFGNPVYRVHRDEIIEELQNLIDKKERGVLSRISVFADLPEQGSRRPAYLADMLPTVKKEVAPSDDEESEWKDPYADGTEEEDPEEDDRNAPNVFVDVEFEVVSLDKENNKVVAMPFSLRRKNITTPIDPKDIMEISFKRAQEIPSIPASMRKGVNMLTNKDIDPNQNS